MGGVVQEFYIIGRVKWTVSFFFIKAYIGYKTRISNFFGFGDKLFRLFW
jgi:hypothetical protein